MNRFVKSLRPMGIGVLAAMIVSLGAMAPEQQPAGNWQAQFKKLIPSLNCVLGRKSCSSEEIRKARIKVKAYIAIFGTIAVALGMRYFMSGSIKKQEMSDPLPGGSYFEQVGKQRYDEESQVMESAPLEPVYDMPVEPEIDPEVEAQQNMLAQELQNAWDTARGSGLRKQDNFEQQRRSLSRKYKNNIQFYNYIQQWEPQMDLRRAASGAGY